MKKQFNDIKASLDDSEREGFDSMSPKKDKTETPVLDSYGRDLTKLAEEGSLDPLIGRDKEINRVCQILSRRKKNNPVLLGEPGCVDSNTIITVRKISNNKSHNIIIK
jgi:ATP-dependent Clp protease ATP-binding subunit ClpC